MSSKHDYCPRELRVWAGENGRWQRLVAELKEYKADVVCLQEVKKSHWETDILPAMEELGYHGIHELEKVQSACDMMGVAMFVKDQIFETISTNALSLRHLVEERFSGKTRKKLKFLDDGILVGLLQHRATGKEVIVAVTHLFWDPNFPHVKASQAELACLAINNFARREGKTGTPVVLCGDFNSVPHVQPDFLPAITRNSLRKHSSAKKAGQSTQQQLPAYFNCSGVYHLLHRGYLPTNHPEHPDTFGREIVFNAEEEDSKLMGNNSVFQPPKRVKGEAASCGAFATNLPFRSCYEVARNGKPLPFTTRCLDFTGTLDYVLSTFPEAAVLEVLEMPYNEAVPSAAAATNASSEGSEESSSSSNTGSGGGGVSIEDVASSFPYIPNAQFPSDHLAMGVVLDLSATPDKTATSAAPTGSCSISSSSSGTAAAASSVATGQVSNMNYHV